MSTGRPQSEGERGVCWASFIWRGVDPRATGAACRARYGARPRHVGADSRRRAVERTQGRAAPAVRAARSAAPARPARESFRRRRTSAAPCCSRCSPGSRAGSARSAAGSRPSTWCMSGRQSTAHGEAGRGRRTWAARVQEAADASALPPAAAAGLCLPSCRCSWQGGHAASRAHDTRQRPAGAAPAPGRSLPALPPPPTPTLPAGSTA